MRIYPGLLPLSYATNLSRMQVLRTLRRRASLWLLVLLLPVLHGCFDIEEEITFQRDGSGLYRITVDMTDLLSLIENMTGSAESGSRQEFFYKMDSTMQAMAETLRSTPGISEVVRTHEQARYTISYRFEHIEALNAAASANTVPGAAPSAFSPAYAWTGKQLTRVEAPMSAVLNPGESDEATLQMARTIFTDATYRIVYHLPGKVRKITNSQARISSDRTSVTLDLGFVDLLEGAVNVGNTITFKNR